jgi:DNA repair protein RecN (Recombination protein N)
MLREFTVQNLALIDDTRIELTPGFCAWTGETGAGKSLLLGGLGLLLGERGSHDLIRSGNDELRVSGVFDIRSDDQRAAIENVLGDPLGDEPLILSRRLSRSGRNSAYLNDHPITVATLRKVGELLVDIHGQRESHSLLEPNYQLRLLDAFGKLESAFERYRVAADVMRELRRRHAELTSRQLERQRELALTRFERDELDQATLRLGESVELQREYDRLRHAQSLQEFAATGYSLIYDQEGSVVELLGRLLKESHQWEAMDPSLGDLSKRLASLVPEIEDLAATFRDMQIRFESDPARLDEVERRLAFLRKLETKYRKPIDELVAYHASLDRRQTELEKQEDDLSGLNREMESALARVREESAALSKLRAKVAKKFAAETRRHLADLGMPKAELEAALTVQPIGDDPVGSPLPVWGADTVELILAANPGEPALPLRKVASGGELSRVMLALKSVLAAHDPVGTLVFDEIDANVGGRLGDVLGEKLAALGKSHQVICVTHLPQVACYAPHQWTIRKQVRGKRTTSSIRQLSDAERIDELAGMMRGQAVGENTRREAEAMLAAARGYW